jgi:Reverse transcriptase (RNA-dependent DNA polymerase)
LTDLINPSEVRRGVRQGCILSPTLFNIYSEAIFCEALENESSGILINGETVNNLRYADDTIIIADNEKDLQRLLQEVNEKSEKYGLTINLNKTKVMIVTKKINAHVNIKIGNNNIEQVTSYKYLGTWVQQNWNHRKEILARIEYARAAFIKMKKFLTCPDLNLELRLRFTRCYIFPILLYGVESWTLTKETTNRIQAFEFWIYRRLLRISWIDKISNKKVLELMNKELDLTFSIKKRKLEYLGHITRGEKYRLLQLIIEGKIQGKRSVGRRRISWLKNLRDWYNLSSVELFRAAVSKIRIAMLISNLRKETLQ